MTTVHDAAAYILLKRGPMSAMKLQKLVYYAQAWSLVWDERPLFPEKIKAWANGPVCPDLYTKHKGLFTVASKHVGGDLRRLDVDAKETIDAVLGFYGDKTAQWLSDLTHREQPWKDARGNLTADDKKSPEITHASMRDYYGKLSRSAS